MTLNVTEHDIRIERLVMAKVKDRYKPFKHMRFKHNVDDDAALYDFYGYYLGVHRISVDVKAIYTDPNKYDSNIVSLDKWQEFIDNNTRIDFYVVYYYPDHDHIKIYDLGKCYSAGVGFANIYHKRQKQSRRDRVAYLNSPPDFEIKGVKKNGYNRAAKIIRRAFRTNR